jgi:nucleotide-binding universal stress UspA family protein
MFKNILVPLDGSSLAEVILPAARSLGGHLGARVTLLHVVEPSAPATIHGDRHLGAATEAQDYLKRIARQFGEVGVNADWHVDVVERGDVAKTIFAHCGELNADIVMLTSHGASGLRGIVFGSIAQQVLQSGKVPVFMQRPESARPEFDLKRILVPLDSSALYEPALELASELATRYGASLHIVVVVPTMTTLSPERAATGVLLPSSTKAILDLAQDGAVEYLQKKLLAYKARGVSITAEVERGDTAPKILEVAGRNPTDLLVMATHGRAGLDAFWQGSVTPKVLSRAKAPVLMLRVEGPEPLR